MGRYSSEAEAAADGYRIEHEPDRHRFVVQLTTGPDARTLGDAHYTLRGDDVIDFDHTEVHPDLRGTGLAGLLVRHALADPVVSGRTVAASCWYVAGMIEREPELLANSKQ